MELNELSQFNLFKDLEAEELKKVCQRLHKHTAEPEEQLINEGEPGKRLYLISQGKVNVLKIIDADRSKVLATLGPGAVMGEISILTGGPRTASVISETATELYYLEREEFVELMHEIPDIAINLARLMCERLRRADREIRQVLLNPL